VAIASAPHHPSHFETDAPAECVSSVSPAMLPSVRAARHIAPYARRRTYASLTNLQPGSKHHGFTLDRTKQIPALELSALHFKHDKTGADYLHIAREDKNNVFSIGFKTNPPDATGVPHILEHVTLCGSEK
jgi:presequence protease